MIKPVTKSFPKLMYRSGAVSFRVPGSSLLRPPQLSLVRYEILKGKNLKCS